jgi:chromosome segregation ATPase
MLNLVSVAASDPMTQVKGLLQNLIEKLVKEAAEAANLHEFCKAEKQKSSDAINKKNNAIDKLNSRMDVATTKSQDLAERVAELSKEVSEMKGAQAKATEIRTQEHENFMKVESDYSQASEAVDDAIDALKEYYGSLSLAQIATKDDQPALGGAKKDSAGGIVSILETMGEDFRKTLKEARSDEKEAQHAFDTMVNENNVAEAAKQSEIQASESEMKSLKVSIHDLSSDHKMASSELAAINEYVSKLKPQCEGRVVPYEERKAKREAEISGLKDALSIIASEGSSQAFAAFVQIRHLRSRV